MIVGGGRKCPLDAGDEGVGLLVQQRQVELELSGKVLVEDGFTDARAFGDLIHRGSVVTLGNENLAGRSQELEAACGSWQSGGLA